MVKEGGAVPVAIAPVSDAPEKKPSLKKSPTSKRPPRGIRRRCTRDNSCREGRERGEGAAGLSFHNRVVQGGDNDTIGALSYSCDPPLQAKSSRRRRVFNFSASIPCRFAERIRHRLQSPNVGNDPLICLLGVIACFFRRRDTNT